MHEEKQAQPCTLNGKLSTDSRQGPWDSLELFVGKKSLSNVVILSRK